MRVPRLLTKCWEAFRTFPHPCISALDLASCWEFSSLQTSTNALAVLKPGGGLHEVGALCSKLG